MREIDVNAAALLELLGFAVAALAAYQLAGLWALVFVLGVFCVYVARSR